HVVLGEILDADIPAHAGRAQDVVRPLPADPIDVGESDLNPLGSREVDACNTCHKSSALPLLVLRIRADHAHDTTPAHDLALVANLFHRCSYFHTSDPDPKALYLLHDPPARQIAPPVPRPPGHPRAAG